MEAEFLNGSEVKSLGNYFSTSKLLFTVAPVSVNDYDVTLEQEVQRHGDYS